MGLSLGSRTGYFSGDLKLLVEDIEALKPTVLHGVPRVWNKIHDKVLAEVEKGSWVKKFIFNRAFDSANHSLTTGQALSSFWNQLVYSKVRAKFGGKLKGVISGAAPLSSKVGNFMKVFLADLVTEGYGLTETVGGGTVGHLSDHQVGHVGTPAPSSRS
eukprot:UN27950